MMQNQILAELEDAWEAEVGFLGKLREGIFDAESYDSFLSTLAKIDFEKDELVPKRVVTLLWFINPFMEWQRERVCQNLSVEQYNKVVESVWNHLERILELP
jgi:hypothetical protein